jgi:outer membrane cobalamin receptor
MKIQTLTLRVFGASILLASLAGAADLKGVVTDPAGRPVPGAHVAAINNVGVIFEQITDDGGRFDFNVSPLFETFQLRVTAAGFQTVTVGAGASAIQLGLAPQSDSIRVTGSAIDVPASQQGTSVSIIPSGEIRERNEAQTVDLMRELPGLLFMQSGPRGSVADLFVRGGDSKYNLVEINGIPVNSFYFGGLFDFSQIPSDFISEIDVARGPQSAVNGSYALASVIDFITRSPENGPALDLVAEGGTHAERRFAISGSGMSHGWGAAISLSSLNDNGPVANSDYRNDNLFLSLQRRWRTQNLFLFGNFNSNDVGEPGPYGSNPKGYFPGSDLVSRSRNNTSADGVHYQDDITSNLRIDVMTGFSLNNSFFVSPFGNSFNKDIRAWGDARGTYTVNSFWTIAGGFAFTREELKNTFVADASLRNFPLRRDNEGIYIENHLTFFNRLFINAGAREEVFQNPFTPGNVNAFPPGPDRAAHSFSRLNPKVSGAWMADGVTRIHASYGTGIRPPGGSELAFTDNPALKPERTESYDFGVERRFVSDRVSVDATWFHNRYRDLIVGLGGSLSTLSHFRSDNVANARAEGTELSARVRPATWVSLTVNYTWLESEVLSLNGGSGLVQQFYYLGQPLLRRPKQTGSLLAMLHYRRIDANIIGYARGRSLDVEPNDGLFGGLFWNPGFASFAVNLNYRVRGNLTAYVNLRNAFNRRYEEIYGFPAPLLNVVAGLKWSLARAR